MTTLAMKAATSLEAHLAGTAVDAGDMLPDLQTANSWTQKVEQVDPLELLGAACNATAPFILTRDCARRCAPPAWPVRDVPTS